MTLPSKSVLQVVPCIYDEGSIELRPCRIHALQEHVHLAVCPVCLQPLTADLTPAFCIDTFDAPGWICQWDADAERSVLSTSELLEMYPGRADNHTPTACCRCDTYHVASGALIHGPFGKRRFGKPDLKPGSSCKPPIADDPTRLRGCYCDRATATGRQP